MMRFIAVRRASLCVLVHLFFNHKGNFFQTYSESARSDNRKTTPTLKSLTSRLETKLCGTVRENYTSVILSFLTINGYTVKDEKPEPKNLKEKANVFFMGKKLCAMSLSRIRLTAIY